jgi:hypothetical protein
MHQLPVPNASGKDLEKALVDFLSCPSFFCPSFLTTNGWSSQENSSGAFPVCHQENARGPDESRMGLFQMTHILYQTS